SGRSPINTFAYRPDALRTGLRTQRHTPVVAAPAGPRAGGYRRAIRVPQGRSSGRAAESACREWRRGRPRDQAGQREITPNERDQAWRIASPSISIVTLRP